MQCDSLIASLGAPPEHLPHAVGDLGCGAPPALAAERHVVAERLLQQPGCGCTASLLRPPHLGRLVPHGLRAEPAEPPPAEGRPHADDVVPGAVLPQAAALALGALHFLHGQRSIEMVQLKASNSERAELRSNGAVCLHVKEMGSGLYKAEHSTKLTRYMCSCYRGTQRED